MAVCGICGQIFADKSKKVTQHHIKKMCSVLKHRGPDDEGVFVQDHVGLGHRRLSVIDVGPTGHQPMCNEDRTIWIVFNGEIYNFPELRCSLEEKGHKFSSQTDTETVIHLYEEMGIDCLHELRGMFAFAIWDSSKKRLFIARDRLGKKPLVYMHNNKQLLFASELKSLIAKPGNTPGIDPSSIYHYLTYQYIPAPLTIFKGIKKLPPAHYMVYENQNLLIKQYWKLSYRKKIKHDSLQDYSQHCLQVMEDCVKVRLRSDVPFGAFLSGGIDSSIIVAIMSRMLDRPVKTFSIGFEEDQYNELPFARIIADKYQTDHHEFIVKPDIINTLPKLIWHYNEPYADSSAVPTFYLSEKTRQHVTVALNGDGGDECFAGYDRYLMEKKIRAWSKLPLLLNQTAAEKIINLLPRGNSRHSLTNKIRRFVADIYEKPERRYVRWLCHFDNPLKHELCTADFSKSVKNIDSVDIIEQMFYKSDGETFTDRVLNVDVMSYLPDDLLVKVDIATMAHSLEARSPFVDHKMMEFGASLPPELKLRGIRTKFLLKNAIKNLIPKEIINRKKMGFGVPIDRWIRKDLKTMVYDVLLDKTSSERGYFNTPVIEKLLDDHSCGRSNHCYRIWNLLCLELWHRMYT